MPAFAATLTGPLEFFSRLFASEDPFRGLYRLNAFDLAIVVPYFAVLGVLAFYGLHRYQLVYLYRRYRANRTLAPGGEHAATAFSAAGDAPHVTIQVPVYNEQYVVERLIDAVAAMDYPRERLEIQVLDDSIDETVAIARAAVERHARAGVNIHHLHRADRTGYKAGALAEGLKAARGEFITIFDADFIPPADFLRRTLPCFADPAVGMVQTRWSYVNRHYSLLTEVQAILLDGHFVLEHGARSRSGLFFNFNGTAGIWRRAAIEDAGGWEFDTLTEDTDLSYRAQIRGWRFLYLPDVECPSELPVDINAFKTQQARWAKGLMQTAKKTLPRVFRARVPWRVKFEAFYHLTGSISYPLMVLLSLLVLPAMIVRFHQGWWQMLWIDLPLFLAATMSVSTFYLMAQRELEPRRWRRTFLFLPLLMAVGIGLALRNARAVLEALWGLESPFVRTPKYRIESRRAAWHSKVYRVADRNLLPWVELGLGGYFVWAAVYAFFNGNYATVPFLCLFLWGYSYTGLLSLTQPYWARLAQWQRPDGWLRHGRSWRLPQRSL